MKNVRGISVCYFTLSLELADRGGSVCSFTGLDLAERCVIVLDFIWTDLLEQGVNQCSLSRLSVLVDLGVHDFYFS